MHLVLTFHDPRADIRLSSCVLPAEIDHNGSPRAIYGAKLPEEAASGLKNAFATWARHGNVHRGQAWNLDDAAEIDDGARGLVETIDHVVTEFDEGEEAAGAFGRHDGQMADLNYDGVRWEFRADGQDAPWVVGAPMSDDAVALWNEAEEELVQVCARLHDLLAAVHRLPPDVQDPFTRAYPFTRDLHEEVHAVGAWLNDVQAQHAKRES